MRRRYIGQLGVPFGTEGHVVTYRESRLWWLMIGPLAGWLIGLSTAWWLRGVVGWTVAAVLWTAGVMTLLWWARWSSRAQLHTELLAELVDKTYGVMSRDGATVVIAPGDHPEVDGVVNVYYPRRDDGDETAGLREP